MGPHRVGVGLPHVHAHRLDPGQLFGAELLEIAIQAGLSTLVGQVLDGAPGEVAHDGDVVMAPSGRLLVHAHQRGHRQLLDRLAPGHGPLHQVPRLIPAGAE